MNDRQKTLEKAFGSIQNFQDAGEAFVRSRGVYGTALDDLVSEFCFAGLSAAGKVQETFEPRQIKKYITKRARGAVKDYIRDKVFQDRLQTKYETVSINATASDHEDMALIDSLEDNPAYQPSYVAELNEEKSLFIEAMKTVTPKQRRLIQEVLNGYSLTQIAKKKKISKQAVYKQYHTALLNIQVAVA